jgi:hypothetical protein
MTFAGLASSEEAEAEEARHAAGEPLDPFIDWRAFWNRDRSEAEWLVDQILASGRGHSFYASQKTGRSLLLLWIATQLATGPEPFTVIYVDYEMADDDLFERLSDMGYGPDDDLSRLRYWQLPSLDALDTEAGGTTFLEWIDRVAWQRPADHIVVIIDTYSRAVAGAENDSDTTRAFYRHTGLGPKQRQITYARADHAGKDVTRGQRGSSAKGDDVDVVWRVERTDDGLLLARDVSRMGWVPERVALARMDDPLRYVVAVAAWPAGTKTLADVLDGLGLPFDATNRQSREALKRANKTATNAVLRAAIKYRKQAAEGSAHASAHPRGTESAHESAHDVEPAETQGGTDLGTPRHTPKSQGDSGRNTRYGTPPDRTEELIRSLNAQVVGEQ